MRFNQLKVPIFLSILFLLFSQASSFGQIQSIPVAPNDSVAGISIYFISGGQMLKRKRLPIKPENPKWLFENSDLISYGEIVDVDREVDTTVHKKQPPGIYPSFEMQLCRVKLLKVLKGSDELKGKIITVIKKRSRYYFKKGQKRVLYLKEHYRIYETVDLFGGEHRLVSALCNINTIKNIQRGGIVAGVLNKGKENYLRIYIVRERQKAGVTIGDKIWKKYLLKTAQIGEFDIAEVSLEKGNYTVLLEFNNNLYPHSRLVEGCYPYVIITKGRWKPLYFDMDEIKEKL